MLIFNRQGGNQRLLNSETAKKPAIDIPVVHITNGTYPVSIQGCWDTCVPSMIHKHCYSIAGPFAPSADRSA